jgi:hypothetical protein
MALRAWRDIGAGDDPHKQQNRCPVIARGNRTHLA